MRRLVLLSALAALACGGTETPEQAETTSGHEEETTVEVSFDRAPERDALGELSLVSAPSASPMVTLRVAFDAGSAEDPGGREGLTRLTAQMMSEGGAGELTFAERTERLFPMAGQIGAHTGRDQTVFVGRVHRDHLEAFYALFRDALLRPTFAEDDFARLRDRAKSALTLELRSNDDEELGKETLHAMLYEGHPYAHPPLGSEAGLDAITLEDVRGQRRRVFCAGRATVGVAGGYPEGFDAQVAQDMRELSFEECVGRVGLPDRDSIDSARVWLVNKPEAQAVAISMGVPIGVTREHPDYPALLLAAAWLGQHRTFAGRLMNEMRGERGLNYGDYAYAEHFDQDGWSAFPLPNVSRRQQYFSIWVRPVRAEQAHFALRMAVRELRRFVEVGLTDEDLNRIRSFITGYYALFLQTESRRLGFAIDDRYYGVEQPWIDRLRESWASLTTQQVNDAIRRHIDPSRLQIAVISPDAAAFADTIAGDRISPIQYPTPPSAEVLEEDRIITGYRVSIPRQEMTVIPLEDVFAR